jgi:hypothetical protein
MAPALPMWQTPACGAAANSSRAAARSVTDTGHRTSLMNRGAGGQGAHEPFVLGIAGVEHLMTA